MTDSTLLIIDGHSVAFRAFYALPKDSFHLDDDRYTNATYGFMSMLIKMIDDHHPTHIAVAFDLSRHSFRTDIYPEYKGGRDETPKEFIGQVDDIQRLLKAMNIPVLTKENIEADDILATLAKKASDDGMNVLVSSGDRDTMQLVNDKVTVLYHGRSTADLQIMTPEAVEAKYGVSPQRYPELAALVGEKADNLPGVDLVGDKTAANLLNKYDGLENLLAHANEIGGKRGENLRAQIDDVKRNRRLNRLVNDLDLDVELPDLIREPFNRHDINAICDDLAFGRLRQRILATDIAPVEEDEADTSLPDPRRVEVVHPTSLKAFLDDIDFYDSDNPTALIVSGDMRPGLGDAHTVAMARDGKAVVLDLITLNDDDRKTLTDICEDSDMMKKCVMFDRKSAWHGLKGAGINLAQGADDLELIAYLLEPDARGYACGDLVFKYLGIDSIDSPDNDSSEPQQGMLDFGDGEQTVKAVYAQAVADLYPLLYQRLEKAHQRALYHDIELPVQDVLIRMEDSGIGFDKERSEQLHADFQHLVANAESRARETAGEDVNLNSPAQLQTVLFDKLNMPKTKKTKRGYTTNAAALNDLYAKTQHPFLQHLLDYRDKTKMLQIVDGLITARQDDGRIHSRFMQTVAATGRLSSVDPNLQNIPARTDEGLQIRSAFVALPNHDTNYVGLLTADYSQIEMRIMAHMSGDKRLQEAFASGEDLHRSVAAIVFDVPAKDVTPQMRSRVKATSYGLAYGLSVYGLSTQLDIPVADAGELMDTYFERFGGIRDYLHNIVRQAREVGYTETMMGRRRYLPGLESSNRQIREAAERAALNAPIQGSAADIIKLAMIDLDQKLCEGDYRSRLLLQVHDELVVEVAEGEREKVEDLVRTCMSSTVSLDVPLDVSVGYGDNWLNAAH